MSAPPYMKLYIADYLADTTHLSREEHGAYLLLLMALWRAGGKLPNEPLKLAKLAKCSMPEWESISDTVMEFFTVCGGALTQKRASMEIAKYRAVVIGSKKASKASVIQRANKNNELASTNVATNDERSFSQPEPKPEPDFRELSFPKEGGSPSAPAPAKPKPEAKGTRLPEDWFPSVSDIEWAEGHTPESLRREADKFRDYWRAVPGAKGRKLDWDATWRNWVRRANEGQQQRNSNVQRPDAKRSAREENYARAFSGAQAASRQRSF